jgi:hypothetical protein
MRISGSGAAILSGAWPLPRAFFGSITPVAAVREDHSTPARKAIRIALTSFRKLDNFLGDYRYNEIVSIHKSEGSARYFERDTHDALGLSVEFMAV